MGLEIFLVILTLWVKFQLEPRIEEPQIPVRMFYQQPLSPGNSIASSPIRES